MNKKIKPMVYSTFIDSDILCDDIYKGYRYIILSFGCYPTAYIELKRNNCLYGLNYNKINDCINLKVNGDLTYSDKILLVPLNICHLKCWYIGWDYAHFTDYYPRISENGKKWTTREIIKECKRAINIIIDYDKHCKELEVFQPDDKEWN